MAYVADAEAVEARAGAQPDLRFLMEREKVPEKLQDEVYKIGIQTVRQFAALASTAANLATVCKELGTDPATGLVARVAASRFTVAWESAKVRAAKQAEAEADSDIRAVPKPLWSMELATMKQTFEKRWWPLEDNMVLAKSYLEKVLAGIEDSEPKAEPLTEVLHADQADRDVLRPVWDASGQLKVMKAASSVALSTTSEELRRRLTLLGNAWIFASYHQASCAYLKDLGPQLFQEYLSYLLGDFVLGLMAWDASDRAIASPPFGG